MNFVSGDVLVPQIIIESDVVCVFKCGSNAERLVLYMKAEEFLSSALHTAKEDIKQGRLLPSVTAKQGEASHL